ncbi:MAG: hypothetical protein ACLFRV_08000 [Acidimicrobiales bacterium]
MSLPAPLMMYLFGDEALPSTADHQGWMDERVRIRIPCSTREVSWPKLAAHILAAAMWQARRDGLLMIHIEETKRRFFGTKRTTTLLPGTTPSEPDRWQLVIWKAINSTTSRPSLKGIANALDLWDPDRLTSSSGHTLRRVQWEAHERGFLREAPPTEEVGHPINDPTADCAAIDAHRDEGRRFAQEWAYFRDVESMLHDALLDAASFATSTR